MFKNTRTRIETNTEQGQNKFLVALLLMIMALTFAIGRLTAGSGLRHFKTERVEIYLRVNSGVENYDRGTVEFLEADCGYLNHLLSLPEPQRHEELIKFGEKHRRVFE